MNKKFMGDFQQREVSAPGTKSASPAVVHLAGEFKAGEQRCTRCGLVLVKGNKGIATAGTQVTTEGSKVIIGAKKGAPNCA